MLTRCNHHGGEPVSTSYEVSSAVEDDAVRVEGREFLSGADDLRSGTRKSAPSNAWTY